MARPRGKALNPIAFTDLLAKLTPPMTRSEVAAAAGISPGTMSDLISGKVRASDKTAYDLALVLQCDRGSLFPEFVQFGPRGAKDAA